MKKYILLLLVVPFVFACGPSQEDVDLLNAEKDSLRNIELQQANALEGYLASFNEIQENLDRIKEKENIIRSTTLSDEELSDNAKDQINEDILQIYELMLTNKQNLENLESKLKNSNYKLVQFKKMVARLTKELEEKDGEISSLKDQLAQMNFDMENLNLKIGNMERSEDSLQNIKQIQETEIEEKTIALNKAFYVMGTSKELKTNNIISKKGGFVGIGRMAKLNESFNADYFTQIDIRETNSLSIVSKKAKIVTTHPQASYKFVGENPIEKLEIIDAEKFWSVSKYLVIIID